jgi:hypothetical protein
VRSHGPASVVVNHIKVDIDRLLYLNLNLNFELATSTAMSTVMNGPQVGWQSLVRQRLEERDSKEKAFDEIVDNCEW